MNVLNNNIDKFIIDENSKVLNALEKLNLQSSDYALTLFVIDGNNRIVGTITDGDIRRAMLFYRTLDLDVKILMKRDFTYLTQGEDNLSTLQKIKKLRLKLVPIVNERMQIVRILNFAKYRSFLPIDAVLMAGGKGERLKPLTLTTPKPLLHVGEKPIIDYNIDNLLNYGIENINVTVNYLKEQIEEHFSKRHDSGVQIKCVREPKYLGTMGSVKFVKEWHNDTVLIMNSDLFTNIDLEDFYLHFKEHDSDMSIAAVPYSVTVPYGIFEIENTREIKGVREKPSYHYYANAGIYLIKRRVIDLIPDGVFFNATDLIDLLINENKKVIRFPLSGYWIDIGKPEDFKKVQEFARHQNK